MTLYILTHQLSIPASGKQFRNALVILSNLRLIIGDLTANEQ